VDATRRVFVAASLASLGLAGCVAARVESTGDEYSSEESSSSSSSDALGKNPADLSDLRIDDSAWSHDAENDVYYQLGVRFCTNPAADAYESMGVYVPGAYFEASDNGDGTFACRISDTGTVGDYSAATAPIVLPTGTDDYSPQEAPSTYHPDDLIGYLGAGLVYVLPGFRGRAGGENDDGTSYPGGAPWDVADIKAAIRCLRYNADVVPGDRDRIFTFGCSGAGGLSALVGATGDSALYTAYLESIGAIFSNDDGESLSDSIAGAMCWCPDTALDEADEAYEWMMGQYASGGTRADGTFTKLLSDDLSDAFVSYINSIGLAADGETLNLCEGGDGDYTAGSYYDHLQSVIEGSLNDFLADTTFPYTTSVAAADSKRTSRASAAASPGHGGTAGSFTFETAADYVSSLNDGERWVTYDAATNTATITSIGAFVRHCRPARKDVGAFDALDRSQTENQLFCDSSSSARHFDKTMSQLLSDHKKEYASCPDFSPDYAQDYSADLATADELGVSMSTRVNMYNPLYFLLDSYAGYGTSRVAGSWRIRSGVDQSDTSLTTEVNLALALAMGDKDVDFATVWAQGNGSVERFGDSTSDLIQWIASCV
jgi:hypothetical protein